jgi:hypothetical protein
VLTTTVQLRIGTHFGYYLIVSRDKLSLCYHPSVWRVRPGVRPRYRPVSPVFDMGLSTNSNPRF